MALPSSTEAEHGQDISLSCTARNGASVSNDLSFVWQYNEMDLVEDTNSRVMISTDDDTSNVATSNLTFSPVLLNDSGNYTCLVHNRVQEDGIVSTTDLILTGEHTQIIVVTVL